MIRIFLGSIALAFIVACKSDEKQTVSFEYDTQLLQRIRAAATVIPGPLPTAIHYTKFAESIRPWNTIIEDGGEDPAKMARTAFQIIFPDGWIMVDAGMDRQVHKFFEKEKSQPFNEQRAANVRRAVEQARLIVVTHEHGDHVAGVIRTANTGGVPQKTILTTEQLDNLMNDPQMEEIKLNENTSKQYIVTDFESILPVAPGVVLIKAPGHTRGQIIVYARLQNAQEYMFTGDVTWSYKGIAEQKQKPDDEIDRINENDDLIKKQISWLHQLQTRERITMLVSHDDIMLPQFAAQGLIRDTLVSQ